MLLITGMDTFLKVATLDKVKHVLLLTVGVNFEKKEVFASSWIILSF